MLAVQSNNWTKENAKEQFVDLTQKLDIQHTFSFEEAWSFVENKRKQEEFQKLVSSFEKAVNNHERSLGKDLHKINPTKHSFVDGQYIREIFNPAGIVLVTKIHAKDHPFFLMKGEMSILTKEGTQRIKAPYQGITKAGTKRIIYTHSDCIFTTVHRTDCLTVDEVENEVIAKSFDDLILSAPETKHLENLIKELEGTKCLL